jgi:hypothetical protein
VEAQSAAAGNEAKGKAYDQQQQQGCGHADPGSQDGARKDGHAQEHDGF